MFGFLNLFFSSFFVFKNIKKVIKIPNMDICNNQALIFFFYSGRLRDVITYTSKLGLKKSNLDH